MLPPRRENMTIAHSPRPTIRTRSGVRPINSFVRNVENIVIPLCQDPKSKRCAGSVGIDATGWIIKGLRKTIRHGRVRREGADHATCTLGLGVLHDADRQRSSRYHCLPCTRCRFPGSYLILYGSEEFPALYWERRVARVRLRPPVPRPHPFPGRSW